MGCVYCTHFHFNAYRKGVHLRVCPEETPLLQCLWCEDPGTVGVWSLTSGQSQMFLGWDSRQMGPLGSRSSAPPVCRCVQIMTCGTQASWDSYECDPTVNLKTLEEFFFNEWRDGSMGKVLT